MKESKMEVTAFQLASRFIGLKEIPGENHNPMILAMLKLHNEWPQEDEVPWCSAFVNFISFLLNLPGTKSLAAISWETTGRAISIEEAKKGFDIVVLRRGEGWQRHVGFYSHHNKENVWLLGGNQNNQVNVAPFSIERISAVRRLWEGD